MKSLIGNSRRPDVTFYRSGRIDITSRIAKALNISNGDVIDVCEHQGEYYLYIHLKGNAVVGRHQAQCFASKNNSCNFRAYSKQICKELLKNTDREVARFATGEIALIPDLGLAVPIITRFFVEK